MFASSQRSRCRPHRDRGGKKPKEFTGKEVGRKLKRHTERGSKRMKELTWRGVGKNKMKKYRRIGSWRPEESRREEREEEELE